MKSYLIKLIISILPIIFFFAATGQTVKIDKRLEKVFSIEYLESLQKNSPSTLEILNYDLDNSWFLAGSELDSKAKGMDYLYYKDLQTGKKTDKKVTSIDPDNVNINEFYIEKQYGAHVIYKIADSGTYIGFYSLKQNAINFNTFKKSMTYENSK